jgi:hypothetical protein
MYVIVHWLEMSQYCLKPHADLTNSNFSNVANIQSYCATDEESPYASRKTAKFLHITAWHKTLANERTEQNPNIADNIADID